MAGPGAIQGGGGPQPIDWGSPVKTEFAQNLDQQKLVKSPFGDVTDVTKIDIDKMPKPEINVSQVLERAQVVLADPNLPQPTRDQINAQLEKINAGMQQTPPVVDLAAILKLQMLTMPAGPEINLTEIMRDAYVMLADPDPKISKDDIKAQLDKIQAGMQQKPPVVDLAAVMKLQVLIKPAGPDPTARLPKT